MKLSNFSLHYLRTKTVISKFILYEKPTNFALEQNRFNKGQCYAEGPGYLSI